MKNTSYLQVLPPKEGESYASFNIYLLADENSSFVQYRFRYVLCPVNPELTFAGGTNDPANSNHYRICEAYVGTLDGETFTPMYRALQLGEIGMALKEEGAGDFSGGFHGDEVMLAVSLWADGCEIPLYAPSFRSFDTAEFSMTTHVFRCNTPDLPLLVKEQRYTITGDTIRLAQTITWLADAKPLVAAYSPMLTAQRVNSTDPSKILTDTVEFLREPGGEVIASYDTTPCGPSADGKYADNVMLNTPATAVRVYKKNGGFSAEAGYRIVNDSIPASQISSFLAIRYLGTGADNKIYFNIAAGAQPKAGTVWQSDIYYRLRILPAEKN